jgi:hypothetical protein
MDASGMEARLEGRGGRLIQKRRPDEGLGLVPPD